MDIKEYIQSGIIESYALGSLNDQETREVECMSHIYPEIKEHLLHLQTTIEQWAESNAQEPPAELKAQILAKVKGLEQASAKKPETPVVSIKPSSSVLKYAAAASVLLALGTAYFWYTSSNELESTRQQLTEVKTELESLEANNADLLAENSRLDSEANSANRKASLIAQPDTRMIELKGTDNFKESLVRVYWNEPEGFASFVVDNLPEPPSALQYQLWAIVDGTPVSLGVFNLDEALLANGLREIDAKITSSQAFAITLEQLGGSPTPNLEALVVIGEV